MDRQVVTQKIIEAKVKHHMKWGQIAQEIGTSPEALYREIARRRIR